MILTGIVLASLYGLAYSSGVHEPLAHAPVVTATSSQYFERTFNRLLAAPPPVIPVAPEPPVFVEPAHALPVPVNPQQALPIQPFAVQPVQPVQPAHQPQPNDPNVAIAIATAHAAAPVATILLPPYPFGHPPIFGFIPQEQAPTEDKTKEVTTTTQTPSTQIEVLTTKDQESTTPMPAGSDNSFAQALPSNENVNFKQYLAPALPVQQAPNQHLANPQPQPQPAPHHHHHHHHPHGHLHLHAIRPQKLKTYVEVERAPLAYIAPPPMPQYPHNHQSIKVVKHVHTFIPSHAKLIIRPVSHSYKKVPAKLIAYTHLPKNTAHRQNLILPTKNANNFRSSPQLSYGPPRP